MSKSDREFLQERLAATIAEAESLQVQVDTALRYAEQVWWTWDLRRGRLKIRAAGDCILGYPHEDLDHNENFWWDRIHPEDLAEVKQTLRDSMKSPDKIWRCEHRLQDVTGDWVWVEQSGFVNQSDADGNAVEMVGTTRKTQERYQLLDLFRGSETLVDALVDSAPVAFWVRDPEGAILLCSQTMKEQFGPLETIESFGKLASPEDHATWRESFQSALRDHPAEHAMTMRLADGSSKAIGLHIIPLTEGTQTFAVLEVFTGF